MSSNTTNVVTLAGAREAVMTMRHTGLACPCCDQYARVYRRRLNASMVRALLCMYVEAGTTDYVHTPTLLAGKRGEEARLSYWSLIRESDGERTDGGRRGWWRVTDRGELFLNGDITVPSHALVYNGRCLQLDGDPIGVRDALGSGFDLRELLRS
jgi:hypothetical protein